LTSAMTLEFIEHNFEVLTEPAHPRELLDRLQRLGA
jgi:hypothetical protein